MKDWKKEMAIEMKRLGILENFSTRKDDIAFSFTTSFEKFLFERIDNAHKHVFHDETVDEDIIVMQGVWRAVYDFVSEPIDREKIVRCMEFVFNHLMKQKYGEPIPKVKRFHSRVKEFFEEVHSIPLYESEVKKIKKLLEK